MIELNFTDQELQSLINLLDAGVKSVGLRGVKEAAALLEKLEAVVPQQSEPAEP